MAGDFVDVRRLFLVRQSMPLVNAFLLTHVPARMRASGGSEPPGQSGVIAQEFDYTPEALPQGIYAAQLATASVPEHGDTVLIRVDAGVTWFPARTAAEHLDVASIRAVTVSAALSGPKPHHVTRTFTSPALIARMASILNGRPAAPDFGLMHCPAIFVTYQLKFSPRTASSPDVVVALTGCVVDEITVNGKAQPALLGDAALDAAASQLLHIKTPYAG
jgi:hypothetical protein